MYGTHAETQPLAMLSSSPPRAIMAESAKAGVSGAPDDAADAGGVADAPSMAGPGACVDGAAGSPAAAPSVKAAGVEEAGAFLAFSANLAAAATASIWARWAFHARRFPSRASRARDGGSASKM